MSIASVRANLANRIDQIEGMKGYAEPPNIIGEWPCVVIGNVLKADYQQPGNLTNWQFQVVLLVEPAKDASEAYPNLDVYIDKRGTKSIKAAIEGGGVGDYAYVRTCDYAGIIIYKDTRFYGAEFTVEVGDTT
jgi:hypothetical protein